MAPTFRLLVDRDLPALEAFLLEHTDSSMFLRSNLKRAGLKFRGRPFEATWAGAFEGQRLVAVAAHAWNGNLILQAPAHAAPLCATALRESRRALAGMVGPWAQLQTARIGLGLQAEPTTLADAELLFTLSLNALNPPKELSDGVVRCRLALAQDLERCAQWRLEYSIEALAQKDSRALREDTKDAVINLITARELYVLEANGAVVACSAFNAALPDCVQVGGVFTPPALRGRGYARAVVAGSLLHRKGQGVGRASLFTNGDNEPAQRAYQSLGFQHAGSYGLLFFARTVRVP
ncbi:MAG: GNAT family N-acetyltransferase [Myxococcaceae bacterium]